VLGSGSAESVLRNIALDLGLQDRVFFKGWISHASVGDFLAASDIGVIPHPATQHTNTTVPNKLFDYMAYGKPVLASDTKPVQRIINSERCGLIYQHDSPKDFYHKLMELEDPMLRRKMGARARLAVQERYNWEYDSKDLLKALHASFGRALL
jgi:glycosyltransferase involved in cell wall biosynthesis